MSELLTVKSQLETLGRSVAEMISLHKQWAIDKDSIIDSSVRRATEDVSTKHEALSRTVEELATKQNRIVAPNEDNALIHGKSAAAWTGEFNKSRVQLNVHRGIHIDPLTPAETNKYTKAFEAYSRFGKDAMSPDQLKTMTVGSDPDGGYWITPPVLASWIVTRIFETSPMRQLATVQPIGAHSFRIQEDPNELSAGWVAEESTRPVTNTPAVGIKEITPQEMYAQPSVSQTMIEDSAIDVEEYLANKASDKMSRVENTAFMIGTGVGQPKGILSYLAGTTWNTIEQIGTGTSGVFTYAGLVKLITSVKDAYQANAEFMLRRQSTMNVMTLQDGNGRYIFQPIVNGAFNSTPLLGYKMNYAADMPAPAAGSLSLVFGDFKRAYVIVDRVGISMLRDNLTNKPNVLFYFRKRVGGGVQDFDAVKIQILS